MTFQKSLDEIKQGMLTHIQAAQENGYLPKVLNFYRGPFRGLIELWAFGLYQLYAVLDNATKQATPTEADEDGWVERHIEQVGLERKSARRTSGRLKLKRANAQGNFVVPPGRTFSTLPDGNGNVFRFLSTQEEVLPDGVLTGEINITAEKEGAEYNVSPFSIVDIKTYIPGIESAENSYDWIDIEGTDVESMESMKERYRLAWKGLGGCNKHAYESWALSVNGVNTVKILDNHPRGQGTIDVLVLGNAGFPTAQLITDVSAIIEEHRPLNDNVQVYGPVEKQIHISARLVLTDNADADRILVDVKQALIDLFDPLTGLGIGTDVTRDRLIAACMLNTQIKRIEWVSPAWDESGLIPVADKEIAILGSIPELSYVLEEE